MGTAHSIRDFLASIRNLVGEMGCLFSKEDKQKSRAAKYEVQVRGELVRAKNMVTLVPTRPGSPPIHLSCVTTFFIPIQSATCHLFFFFFSWSMIFRSKRSQREGCTPHATWSRRFSLLSHPSPHDDDNGRTPRRAAPRKRRFPPSLLGPTPRLLLRPFPPRLRRLPSPSLTPRISYSSRGRGRS